MQLEWKLLQNYTEQMWQVEAKKEARLLYILQNFFQSLEIRWKEGTEGRGTEEWSKETRATNREFKHHTLAYLENFGSMTFIFRAFVMWSTLVLPE
jgi:hypothetical protein